MVDTETKRSSLWANLLGACFAVCLVLTVFHDLPLLRQPAADLRHMVPPALAFHVFFFLGCVAFMVPLALVLLLLRRREIQWPMVLLIGAVVCVAVLLAYPRARGLVLEGDFLEQAGSSQVVLIRETFGERPTLVIHAASESGGNLLWEKIREAAHPAGKRMAKESGPVLLQNPFYPEPDWDAFVSLELAAEEYEELAATVVPWLLERARPRGFAQADSPRSLHTILFLNGDRVYGVTTPPGGLAGVVELMEPRLPEPSRVHLEPWK